MSKTLGNGHELKEENQLLCRKDVGKMYLFNLLMLLYPQMAVKEVENMK